MVELAELLDVPSPRGRKTTLSVSKRRDMVPSDVEALANAKPLEPVSPVMQLRHQHHLLARLLAEGKSVTETSLITGYSVTYISRLQNVDKAFKELVVYYKENTEEIYYSVHERLKGLGLNSIDELQERLAQDPNSFKNRELMELAALTFDRAGFGPVSTNRTISTSLTAEDISRLKDVIDSRKNGTVRQITPNNSRSSGSQTIIEGTVQAEAIERLPSERNDVPENRGTLAREERST